MSIYKTNILLERLDKMVLWTGIHKISELTVRRRSMRILPIATLALGTICFALILIIPDKYLFWYTGLILSFGIGNFYPMFGPVKPRSTPLEDADERELKISRDAYFVTFATISAVAFTGIWILILLTAHENWTRELLIKAMVSMSFYLLTLLATLPTLYASWAIPKLIDDDI